MLTASKLGMENMEWILARAGVLGKPIRTRKNGPCRLHFSSLYVIRE
jgi:hypothetical protein